MARRPIVLAFLAVLAVPATACGGGPGPADEIAPFFELLSSPNVASARLNGRFFALLDEPSRAAVVARAEALSQRLAVPVAPEDVLQVRGLVDAARVSEIKTLAEGATRATVELTLAPIAFVAPGEPAPASHGPASAATAPDTRRLELVKEDGRWRVAFVDLARLVATVPIDAAAEGGTRP